MKLWEITITETKEWYNGCGNKKFEVEIFDKIKGECQSFGDDDLGKLMRKVGRILTKESKNIWY